VFYVHFEIHTPSSSYNLIQDVNVPVTERVRYQEEPEISIEGGEDAILSSFCEYIQAKDPDILFSSNQHSRSTITLDYLFLRMTGLGLDLDFGRDKNTDKPNKIEGRYI
jgi:DNA polymerase elongation subunit (family B)